MQISEPGRAAKARADAGMTLIELLVVVTVLAVLSVGATLTVGRVKGDDVAQDATRFLNTWRLHADLARETRTPQGLLLDTNGMQPMQLGETGWRETGGKVSWGSRVALVAGQGGRRGDVPDLVLLPSGQSTAFTVTFASAQSETLRRCTGGGWTVATCD
ncbi:hypothetical protein GCM10007385_44270 [Tateyamaria omphalii]|uniref:prepilin-type N-terminal cleavage/methylation domain-containing protein n=1 Tax=Tateyamaria omphalii TaxID=299262 RepID=UPI0016726E01|nr:prepilin-type N-terminal cleavage/methylation domain-containing protein [Tateyamaria omphalii]GGX70409.1 hypothetical protein GCM10007385_44270 [Tateyamaria omphalii]